MSPDVPAVEALEPTQAAAVAALLAGQSVQKAADTAGVDRRTIARWKHDEAFQEALSDGQRMIFDEAIGRMVSMVDKAVTTIEAAIAEGNASAAFRLLDGIGLLKRSFALSVQPEANLGSIPPALSPNDAIAVINMAREMRGVPPMEQPRTPNPPPLLPAGNEAVEDSPKDDEVPTDAFSRAIASSSTSG